MSQRHGSVVVVIALFGSIVFLMPMMALPQTSEMTKGYNPYERLEESAKATDANNLATLRAVADEIFKIPRPYPRLPEPAATLIKDRLARAESDYLLGKQPGVEEQDLVNLHNDLVKRFGAPEYARTSLKQVRYLRMTMLFSAPQFMGRGMTKEHAEVGESVKSVMSPLQATQIFMALVDQKILNADYQVEPATWDANYYQKSVEKAQGIQALKESGQLRTTTSVRVGSNSRHVEMHNLLSREFSHITLTNAVEIINEAFSTLKINN